ncbi:hypothetical protein [Rhizobium sp. ZPR3]|uniref:Beta-ketoacyl synthase N-terminal domain-containing protein n=2 Tax=unclassified Rhizobium TaxID=2613769 RepID=A0AAU7SQZ9_9HYPH
MTEDAIIIAAGLCCPLGKNFEAATEAYSKGEKSLVRERSLIGHDGDPITLSYVFVPTEERDYEQRLLNLFKSAFTDCLLRATSLRNAGPLRFGLIVVLPRWLNGHQLTTRLSAAFSAEPYEQIIYKRFCFGAQAAALRMIDLARQDIADREADVVFVAALDSYIDTHLLDRLATEGKAFGSGQPHGLVPGEACAVIAVGKSSLRLETSAEILGFGVGEEATDGKPIGIRGRGLGDALRNAATGLEQSVPVMRALADLNGERWRAEHYGAGIASFGNGLGEALLDPECYALAMGDVGAAAGGVMVALALGAMPSPRGHPAHSEPIKYPTLLVATSHRGRSCALMLAHARRKEA